MFSLVAVGLSLIYGVMDIPSFAQGEYFMIGSLGAYETYTLVGGGIDATGPIATVVPVLALIGGTLAGILAGAITDIVLLRVLRRRVDTNWVLNTFVITIGLSLLLQNGHLIFIGPEYKGIPYYWQGTFSILGIQIALDRLMVIVVGVGAIGLLMYLLRYTTLGRLIRAVSMDEVGAKLQGVPIGRVHFFTWTFGCALAALAGAALLFLFPAYPLVGARPLLYTWTVVILAGLGSVGGAIGAGFIIALLSVLTDQYIGSGWETVVPTLALLAILGLRPYGLFGTAISARAQQ
jgi:branched-chain amino acid transport system permease protein